MSLARSGVRLLRLVVRLAAFAALAARAPSAAAEPPPADEPPRLPLQVAADKDRTKRATALNDEAWVLYEEGRYRAAVDKLEGALRIDPDGRELVYNLALLHEKLADMKEAADYYRRYLEKEPDPKNRARIQATIRRLDGAAKEAAARVPLAQPAPAPPPPPRPLKPWVIATGSFAGAAFVLGAAFGFTALVRNPGPNATTGNGVTIDNLQAAARAAHTDAVIADVCFLFAAAATGTAAFLYFSTPRPARGAAAPHDGGTASALPTPPTPSVAVGPGVLQVRF